MSWNRWNANTAKSSRKSEVVKSFIDKEFKLDQVRYHFFSKQSLFQLELRDNNLHQYVMDWNRILSTLNEPPPEEEMQTFFWEQIQKCNVQRWREKIQPLLIKTSMDPEKSYRSLIQLVQQHLQSEKNFRQEKQSRNAGKMHTHLSNDNNDGNQGRLAYAGTGKHNTGKGNGKAAGTGQRSSKQRLCRNWARYGRCPGYDVNDCGYDHPPHLEQNIGEANDDDDYKQHDR